MDKQERIAASIDKLAALAGRRRSLYAEMNDYTNRAGRSAAALQDTEEALRAARRELTHLIEGGNWSDFVRDVKTEVPSTWTEWHHPNCGTKYRGCDPDNCPKDVYERTGVWIGEKG